MLASELPIELYFERFNFRREKNWTSCKDFDMEIHGSQWFLPARDREKEHNRYTFYFSSVVSDVLIR